MGLWGGGGWGWCRGLIYWGCYWDRLGGCVVVERGVNVGISERGVEFGGVEMVGIDGE